MIVKEILKKKILYQYYVFYLFNLLNVNFTFYNVLIFSKFKFLLIHSTKNLKFNYSILYFLIHN